jgi:hypothetical protein
MSIQPRIGHIVNFKDEDGKLHKGAQVIAKEQGFNFEGKVTVYIVQDENSKKHKVFAEDMEYYKY